METEVTCLEERVVTQVAERVSGSGQVPVHDFPFVSVQTCGCVQVEALHPGLESAATNTLFGYEVFEMRGTKHMSID
jgi:hypothetical protein